MKIIKPSVEILSCPTEKDCLNLLEIAGKTCYQSKIGDSKKFVQQIMRSGHMSVIEHVNITVRIVCDRGVMAELTRHRLASFSISSTRYCNYSKDKFGSEITVIQPCFFSLGSPGGITWKTAMTFAEDAYLVMIKDGASPQEARTVLPNSLATTIVMTANIREYLHILKLRTSQASHPQMREMANILKEKLQERLPIIFKETKRE